MPGVDAVILTVTLVAAAQVSPNGSKGTGALTATYDTVTKRLAYNATSANLTAPATAAHFHGPAAAGANAGVLVPANGEIRGLVTR